MIDEASLWQTGFAGGLLLPAIAAVTLSLFGLPWLAFAETRERTSLAARWTIFAWLHPFWAALIAWAVSAVFLLLIGFLVAGYGMTPAS